jgi:catechol 2,3-dioxygenase-like lactoylglutathione lyase family enzyme
MTGAKPAAVGGLHEIVIGVPDLAIAAAYWRSFGFKPGPMARFGADLGQRLYGVASGGTSQRLTHLDADHGLIRLVHWDTPRHPGVGAVPFRGNGSRWSGQFVRSVLDVANHAAVARRKGMPLHDVPPSFIDLSSYNPTLFSGRPMEPFQDRLVAVREYSVVQPHARQALLERFGYDSKLLGKIDDTCLFRASQIAHGGLMFTSDHADVSDFYDQVLGLKRVLAKETPWEQAMASRGAFDLKEGETHWSLTFEEPRSGPDNDTRRSGRLLMFRFATASALPDYRDGFSPGALGYSLFTWRVRDVQAFRRACETAGSTQLTDVVADEFGVQAFTCAAPDSIVWMFTQASDDERATLAVQ